jgi:GNAT superfamily N-acetyltransferase
VTRPSIVVRDACPDDLPAVLEMWAELREIGGRLERATPPATADGALDRLLAITMDPDSRALIATSGDEIAGMAVLTCSQYAPLFDQIAVHVHYLHVREGNRRRGVGKALLAAAASFAEEVGAEHLMTSVLPQLRETNRFYARLGFSQVVIRRSVPVTVLRRCLMAQGVPGATDNVLVRRRTLRRVRAAMSRAGD